MQIYFDFSGYSDMAIGLGRIFGFHFLENFNYPYISKSITEFWRRWHISLGTWFRDYLYIPLGGNKTTLNDSVKGMEYIDILNCLSIDDYYKTDIHWKQERLGKVVSTLGEKMHFSKSFSGDEFEKKVFFPFYGTYYGQAALPIKPDTLIYLTNDSVEEAIADNYEYMGDDRSSKKVYDIDKLYGIDSYDVFLSGATPFIEVENPKNSSGKELIFFRDSFASSLAPLLLSEYSKITLIDLRYVNSKMIGELVDFNNQDVLFLYNRLIVNNSNILK